MTRRPGIIPVVRGHLRPERSVRVPLVGLGRGSAPRRRTRRLAMPAPSRRSGADGWLGPGSSEPRPTACIEVDGAVVGWVDAGAELPWLQRGEVSVGCNVFEAYRGHGYASRALRLLLSQLAPTGVTPGLRHCPAAMSVALVAGSPHRLRRPVGPHGEQRATHQPVAAATQRATAPARPVRGRAETGTRAAALSQSEPIGRSVIGTGGARAP